MTSKALPPVGATTTTLDIQALTTASKIPDFWCEQPRLWFAQFEAIIKSQKQGDEASFNLALTKLSREVIEQAQDILSQPPEENKYETLKKRLLTVYEESESRRLHRLLNETELGDQKPSQLLRRMQELARNKISDEALKILWAGHLPTTVRAVLAGTGEDQLDKLATMADNIWETTKLAQVAALEPRSTDTGPSLADQVAQLTAELAALKNTTPRKYTVDNGTPFQKQRGYRQSHPARRNQNQCCVFHRKYGPKAHKCAPPCMWGKKYTASEN